MINSDCLLLSKKEALEKITRDKISKKESFSTYQITLGLRNATRDGSIDLVGVPETIIDGEFVYNLPHCRENREIVENVLEEHLNNGNYVCEWLADHRIFKPFLIQKKVDTKDENNLNVDEDCSYQIKPKRKDLLEDEKDILLGYVSRKLNKGQFPTIKNIQSAMKRGENYTHIPVDIIEKEISTEFLFDNNALPLSWRRVVSRKYAS